MAGSDPRTEYRLAITTDAVGLPVGEDARQDILNEIGAHVRTHRADRHGIDVVDDAISVATGSVRCGAGRLSTVGRKPI